MKYFNVELVEEYMKKNNLTPSVFCKLADIPLSELELFLEDNLEIGLDSFFKIAKLIKVYAKDLCKC